VNANRASATARLIAAATVMRHESRKHGAPPAAAAAWCERFLSTTRADRLLLWSARSLPGRAWWRCAESFTVRGIVSHWMRRKREIDRLARQAAAEGFTQLVVLGAGLDTLAFRLSQEGLYGRVLSVDHPATLGVVRAAMSRDAARSPAAIDERSASWGVELLALDLGRDDVCAALTAAPAFDPARATVIVIEGVLMYLPEPAVCSVLRSLAALPTPRLRLIASWMVAEPGQPIGFRGQSRLVPAWLRRRREPMLWASTPSALPVFLDGLGWSNTRLIDLAEHDAIDAADARGLRSEQLAIAERRVRS
jgi:methyltransferase (TIGR00027 family)